MSIENKSMRITPVGGNVFADLGFEPEEAASLKAESQRIIPEKLASSNKRTQRKFLVLHGSAAEAKTD